jgi:hypothetical protein
MTTKGRPRSLPRGSQSFTIRLPRSHVTALTKLARERSAETGGAVSASHIIRTLVERELRKVGYVGQK